MTKIYFASPLFSEMELKYNAQLVSKIKEQFLPNYPDLEIFLPQENMSINDKDSYADSRDIAKADTAELLSSDILVAVLDGQTMDVGVATEIGVAYQAGMPIIGLYTDSRQSGGTNIKKLNALQDLAESQFSYVNLYTVGLIKLNGRVVSTVEGLLGELDFLIGATDSMKKEAELTQFKNLEIGGRNLDFAFSQEGLTIKTINTFKAENTELIKEIIKYVEETAEDFSGELDMGQSFKEQLKEPDEEGSYRFIPKFYFKLNNMLNKEIDKNGEIK